MTVDSYLAVTRGRFDYGDEAMKPLFDNLIKKLNLDVACVVIKSNKAKIEFVKLEGRYYIIWDLTYWKVFEAYLRFRRMLDARDMEKERADEILWNIALNFFGFFKEYYPKRSNASFKFERICWIFGYTELKDYDYSDMAMNECLFKCKLYIFVHEVYHMYFELFPESRREVEEHIHHALKQCESLILEDAVRWADHFKTYFTAGEIKEILYNLTWGKDAVYDELLSDASSFYQTCSVYFTGSAKDAESDWGMFVPKIRNSIFEIRSYELILTTLIGIIDEYESRFDVEPEAMVKKLRSHSKTILLREFIMKYIEIDQLRTLLHELRLEQVLAAYNLDTVPPFRRSYYEFLLPYFEKFAKDIMIPVLEGI